MRRLEPVSRNWGVDRGRPIDRYYIEQFLQANRCLIRGRALEIERAHYIRTFGSGVTQTDVLDIKPGPETTIIDDLTRGDHLPEGAFDCIVLTQALQLIQDLTAAVEVIHRTLRVGGTLLATLPGISQIARDERGGWHDRWRFTSTSVTDLFAPIFGRENLMVEARGNVLASTAFLYGLADHELRPGELEYVDSDYELIVLLRATRSS